MSCGRPRRDTIALFERVFAALDANPSASANAVAALVGARRQDTLRIVRALRASPTRFPNPENHHAAS